MKKHQFEEITAALSILIAMYAWDIGCRWLFVIFTIKAIFDTYCAITAAFRSIVKKRAKKLKDKSEPKQ